MKFARHLRQLALLALLLSPGLALAQTNPPTGSAWIYLGPSVGPGWSPPNELTPMLFGCTGNGVSNDTACMQNAINSVAASGTILYLGHHQYCITGITLNVPITIQGAASGSDAGPAGSGFVNCTPNPAAMITITTGANGSKLDNFSVVAGTDAAPAISGTAIVNNAEQTAITRFMIRNACYAIDDNGNTNTYAMGRINTPALQRNCRVIRLGPTAVSIGPVISNVAIDSIADPVASSNGTVAIGTAGIELLNVGGAYIGGGTEVLYMDYGMLVDPGANQVVDGGWVTHTAFDTVNFDGIHIDTTASTAKIGQLYFDHTWTGSIGQIGGRYGRPPGISVFNPSNGIAIWNNGGGSVAYITFDGHRVEASGGDGVAVHPNVGDVKYTNGFVCGGGLTTANTYRGYSIFSGVAGIQIVSNNTIGETCDTAGGSTLIADFDNEATGIELTLTGNYFVDYPPFGILSAFPAIAVVANNFNIDTRSPLITAAATINPGIYSLVTLGGTTPVSTINGIWAGRVLRILNTGPATFVTGGNITAVPATFPPNQVIECTAFPPNWSCR